MQALPAMADRREATAGCHGATVRRCEGMTVRKAEGGGRRAKGEV